MNAGWYWVKNVPIDHVWAIAYTPPLHIEMFERIRLFISVNRCAGDKGGVCHQKLARLWFVRRSIFRECNKTFPASENAGSRFGLKGDILKANSSTYLICVISISARRHVMEGINYQWLDIVFAFATWLSNRPSKLVKNSPMNALHSKSLDFGKQNIGLRTNIGCWFNKTGRSLKQMKEFVRLLVELLMRFVEQIYKPKRFLTGQLFSKISKFYKFGNARQFSLWKNW